MRERYLKELETLNKDLLKMCIKVVSQINSSIEALCDGNEVLAQSVANDDHIVDEMEKKIEHQCLNILLREQPVATDFRRVSAVLKMITDIERIGDHAQDIAELVLTLHQKSSRSLEFITAMCDIAKDMVSKSVSGFINDDFEFIKIVPQMDDELDKLFEQAKRKLSAHLHNDILLCEDIITLLMIAKYLERIGDHAVNLSEWADYYLKGWR